MTFYTGHDLQTEEIQSILKNVFKKFQRNYIYKKFRKQFPHLKIFYGNFVKLSGKFGSNLETCPGKIRSNFLKFL